MVRKVRNARTIELVEGLRLIRGRQCANDVDYLFAITVGASVEVREICWPRPEHLSLCGTPRFYLLNNHYVAFRVEGVTDVALGEPRPVVDFERANQGLD